MNAPDTVQPTKTGNRALARHKAAAARELLRDVAKLVDGDLPTIHRNTMTAIVAVDDVLDELQSAVDADLREWAIDHNELGKDPG